MILCDTLEGSIGNIFTFKKGDLEKNYLQIEEDYIKLLKSIFAKKKEQTF